MCRFVRSVTEFFFVKHDKNLNEMKLWTKETKKRGKIRRLILSCVMENAEEQEIGEGREFYIVKNYQKDCWSHSRKYQK